MDIKPEHTDALAEMVNIGVGKAAGVLNQMIQSHVSLNVPQVMVYSSDEMQKYLDTQSGPFSFVSMKFAGGLTGMASLLFPPESASNLVSILTGEEADAPDMDSLRTETLNEIGNILINGVLGSVSNMFELQLQYTFPQFAEGTKKGVVESSVESDNVSIIARTTFSVKEHSIEGEFLIIFTLDSFDTLVEAIDLHTGG